MSPDSRLTESLKQRLLPIKAALFDIEGVLVDSSTVHPAFSLNTKGVYPSDKDAIHRAIDAGITVGIITSRASATVDEIAGTLGIVDVYQGYMNKSSAYEEFKSEYGFADEEIAYMGDDILDLAVMKMAGFSAAPFNAHTAIRFAAHFVCKSHGGRGAASEMLSLLFTAQKYGSN